MAVLSLSEVPALRALLAPHGYSIHVQDACGGQAFRLERLSEKTNDEAYPVLEKFFEAHGMTLAYFGSARLEFIAK